MFVLLSGSVMPEPAELHSYRVFQINFDGRLIGADIIEAEDDLDAYSLAKNNLGDTTVEVWDLARFVARIDPRTLAKIEPPKSHKEKRHWEKIERVAVMLFVAALLGYFLVMKLAIKYAADNRSETIDIASSIDKDRT